MLSVWCLVPGNYPTARRLRPLRSLLEDRTIAEKSIDLILSRYLSQHAADPTKELPANPLLWIQIVLGTYAYRSRKRTILGLQRKSCQSLLRELGALAGCAFPTVMLIINNPEKAKFQMATDPFPWFGVLQWVFAAYSILWIWAARRRRAARREKCG